MARQFSLDQVFALMLCPFVFVLLGLLYVIVVPLQGRPFIFSSERMRSADQRFSLLKIRTMHPMRGAECQSALGGDQKSRVTWIGAMLRRTRMDELPQILNVLRGDLRFIGPRPPLGRYVALYPDLYREVLADTPPGITGLATVLLHAREERLLSACLTREETDRVYRQRCIPIKARLDLIYRDRRSWALNVKILWMTVARLLPKKAVPMAVALNSPGVKAIHGGQTGRAAMPVVRTVELRDAA